MLLSASDPDGDVLTVSITTPPTKGTLSAGAAALGYTYVPAANQNGTDQFAYSVSDGRGGTATATVAITITPQQDAPVVTTDRFPGSEDSQLAARIVATDVEGDALSFALGQGTQHGTLNLAADGSFTYAPVANYNGNDQFIAEVSDGTLVTIATISINLAGTNDLPTAADDQARIALTGPTPVNVLANDADIDGEPLTITVESPPPGATAAVNGNAIVITPNAGGGGPTSLRYRISDAAGASSTATLKLVMGDAKPLFFIDTEQRLRIYDYFGVATAASIRVDDGESLNRVLVSANGEQLVYVTRLISAGPIAPGTDQYRVWFKNLLTTNAPVQELTSASGPAIGSVHVSNDGNIVLLKDRVVASATPNQWAAIDATPDATVLISTLTRDGRRVFYALERADLSRVIMRADVTPSGTISSRVQLSANYGAGRGPGSVLYLSASEARIGSSGLMDAPGGGGPITRTVVVSTDGLQNDRVLDAVGPFWLPALMSVDDRFAFTVGYSGYPGNALHFETSDLSAPPGPPVRMTTGAMSNINFSFGASSALYLLKAEMPYPAVGRWYRATMGVADSAVEFAPLGPAAPAPRVVYAAWDSSAVLFDSGAGIYAATDAPGSPGVLLYERPDGSVAPWFGSEPNSLSMNAISGERIVVLNPKAPGWVDALDVQTTTGIYPNCVAYVGQLCGAP